jgi:WD40-like Beta Propeller Repeat
VRGKPVRAPLRTRASGINRNRTRALKRYSALARRVRLSAVLGAITIMLVGCGTTGVESGIYVVDTSEGVPGWTGWPPGIPAWSPVRDSVAWGNEDGLFLAALGDSVRKLSGVPVGGRPAWSPDGKTIAFIDREQGHLVVIDVESGLVQFEEPVVRYGIRAPQRLPVMLGGPTWAPDGSRLAFVCFDGSGDEICVIRADGTGRRQVTDLEPLETLRGTPTPLFTPAAANAGPAAWSPDGSSLAVATYPERSGSSKGVFIVDVERGKARRVSDLLPNSVIGWFPNGRSIYFSAIEPDRSDAAIDRSDVFHVYVRAAAERNLTGGFLTGARNPALSPDGTRLAVESNGDIVILSEQAVPQEYSVAELSATYPAWSADSSAVAFSADPDPISVYD